MLLKLNSNNDELIMKRNVTSKNDNTTKLNIERRRKGTPINDEVFK